MMRRTTIMMMALGLVMSWGCSRIEETTLPDGPLEGVELTVKATLADAGRTRTVLNPDRTIYWTKDDAINLFYGDRSSGKFVSSVGDEPKQTTDFVGTLTVATGASEVGMGAKSFWGVYPYDESNTCDGSGVTMTLPDQQTAVAGTFADKLNPSVATAAGLDLAFYNVGAPFYFSVTQEGVTSATFKGNNDEDVAGKVRVSMDADGYPVSEVLEGVKSITLSAPEGESFVEGETYVLILLPQAQMTSGYTVTFKKGNLEADCVVSKNVQFKRSKGRDKMNADEGLTYTDPSYAVPEYVDLGVSVKWATFNLGSTQPEEYGDYYAWGETEPHTAPLPASFSWEAYKWSEGEDTERHMLTKYCCESLYGYNDFTDGKYILDAEDDAAKAHLGGNWRMPTATELNELGAACTATWMKINDVYGLQFKSNVNGNTIFIPASGWYEDGSYVHNSAIGDTYQLGRIWTSSLYNGDNQLNGSHYGNAQAGTISRLTDQVGTTGMERYCGIPIRPVYDDPATIHVETVTFDKTELELNVGASATLTPTILPADATYQKLVWKSSDTAIATVDSVGRVTGVSEGSTTVYATNYDGRKSASCRVTVSAPTPSVSVPEAVDLGLPSGVKWASFNLGATKPEEYGDYYAWGETEPYYSSLDPLTWKEGKERGYNWAIYKWCMGGYKTMTKYCRSASCGYEGFTDTKTVLDLEDDAAHVSLAGNWRMPTDEEWTELRTKCSWIWMTLNGVKGRKVVGPNGNYIFIPAAGYRFDTSSNYVGSSCYYWSSSLYSGDDWSFCACGVFFTYTFVDGNYKDRSEGMPIRPVSE